MWNDFLPQAWRGPANALVPSTPYYCYCKYSHWPPPVSPLLAAPPVHHYYSLQYIGLTPACPTAPTPAQATPDVTSSQINSVPFPLDLNTPNSNHVERGKGLM